jgi:BirA family transcriptional regulator, biotin operon repressor / biotin---[acetyl-CoA-carboxylase] ligase
MIYKNDLFTILDVVESTNNYAMGQLHAGLAVHGQAWFANEQWGGKGQREKKWISAAGENIIMTIVLKPDKVFKGNLFLFSAFIAGACHRFYSALAAKNTHIKWPNDIYHCDRKAGGILIENIIKGMEWNWSVVGIGINVNQIDFNEELSNATSLKKIIGKTYDVVELAMQLHDIILKELENGSGELLEYALQYYNTYLYKKNEVIKLKKGNAVFETYVKEVNNFGQLVTKDTIERLFNFGEVVWVF